MRAPGRAIPDLEVVAYSRDDDLPVQLGVLDERARQHDATLLVRLGVRGPSEQEAAELTGLPAEGVEPFEPNRHVPPWMNSTVGYGPAPSGR